ncbi:MAG TPA: malectin domain-containing carbohydrate-binding protein [Candidatus Saccharimonadales bacterium]|nr:malectin domain-containing carbohydrate-binding protein [Candidatus Saccharimonadales bacterium]
MLFRKTPVITFLISLFLPFFIASPAFADDVITYTAPNTLVFNKDTTNCQVGSSYSIQIWQGSIGGTLIYNQGNPPSFPQTIDLSTLGLTSGSTYLASEFCTLGPSSFRENVNFVYSAPTPVNPPVTTASLVTQNPDGSYSDPAIVTLSATAAAGFSIAHTYYILDPRQGSTQQEYTGPITVNFSGSHTIRYWSVDNNGDIENANTQDFSITDFFNISNVVFNTSTNQMDWDYTGDTTLNGLRFAFAEIYNATTSKRVVEYTNNYGCNATHCTFTDPTYTDLSNIIPGDTYEVLFELLNPQTNVYTLTPTFINTTTPVTAINAGGDTQGNYGADTGFNGGSTYTSSATVDTTGVDNPAPQSVYQTVRYGNFSYTIPNLTANGTYTLRLHFNELYWGTDGNDGTGKRVFNVSVNGTTALSNFDIYEQAGGANKAIAEQIPATADSNGNITIQFSTVTDNAMVNGIEVYNGTLPSPTPTPTPTPVTSETINAGGETAGSYIADTHNFGGTPFTSIASVDTGGVTNPAPESVYQSVRYGNFSYTIPTYSPNTSYHVRLHFNELYWGTDGSDGTGKRVFNVSINGTQVLNNFDIYQTAGGANKALVEDFDTTTDANGKIHIQFNTVTDNAMVNGIEISKN